MDQTITEYDIDPAAKPYLKTSADGESEPDLAVDGLDDSLASRLIKLFSFRRT